MMMGATVELFVYKSFQTQLQLNSFSVKVIALSLSHPQ